MEYKLTLKLDKETKNTFRYREITTEDKEPIIGTLYIRKSAFSENDPRPEEMDVIINSEEL